MTTPAAASLVGGDDRPEVVSPSGAGGRATGALSAAGTSGVVVVAGGAATGGAAAGVAEGITAGVAGACVASPCARGHRAQSTIASSAKAAIHRSDALRPRSGSGATVSDGVGTGTSVCTGGGTHAVAGSGAGALGIGSGATTGVPGGSGGNCSSPSPTGGWRGASTSAACASRSGKSTGRLRARAEIGQVLEARGNERMPLGQRVDGNPVRAPITVTPRLRDGP